MSEDKFLAIDLKIAHLKEDIMRVENGFKDLWEKREQSSKEDRERIDVALNAILNELSNIKADKIDMLDKALGMSVKAILTILSLASGIIIYLLQKLHLI